MNVALKYVLEAVHMKKIILISAFFQIVIGFAGYVSADEAIGRINALKGFAFARQPDAPGQRNLKVGSPVFVNDTIESSKGSRLQVIFRDGSTIRLGENSELVINQYAFNPELKEANGASFRITRGIIRVITDKITKLNPERFRVLTNYGTIGIRGCDLMFDVRPRDEKVIVVQLHHADSVVVEMNLPATPGSPVNKERAVIRRGGKVIKMSLANGMETVNAVMKELEELDNSTKPEDSEEESSDEPEESGSVQSGVREYESIRSVGERAVKSVQQVDEERVARVEAVADSADLLGTNVDQPSKSADKEPMAASERGRGQDSMEITSSPDSQESDMSLPVVGTRISSTIASGSDWSWGAWEQEIMDLDDDGEMVTYFDRGTFVTGNTITGQKFRDIRDGGIIYNLSGTGQAGAAITAKQRSEFMTGGVELNVLVGGGVTPTWNGDFDVAGGESQLQFSSSGSIMGNGRLNGSLDTYSLNAFGEIKGPPVAQVINGNLVGPGTGDTPVTGAVGQFNFNHNDGTKVDGAFGADLR